MTQHKRMQGLNFFRNKDELTLFVQTKQIASEKVDINGSGYLNDETKVSFGLELEGENSMGFSFETRTLSDGQGRRRLIAGYTHDTSDISTLSMMASMNLHSALSVDDTTSVSAGVGFATRFSDLVFDSAYIMQTSSSLNPSRSNLNIALQYEDGLNRTGMRYSNGSVEYADASLDTLNSQRVELFRGAQILNWDKVYIMLSYSYEYLKGDSTIKGYSDLGVKFRHYF